MNRHQKSRLQRNHRLMIHHLNCLRLKTLHRMTHLPSCRHLNFRRHSSRHQWNHHRSILRQKNRLRLNQHCCLLTNQRRSFRVCFGRNYLAALNCFRVCCWPSFPAWCCCCYSRSTRCSRSTNLKACSIRRRLGLGRLPRRGGISSIAWVSAWRFSVCFGGGCVPACGVDGFAALAGGLLDRVFIAHAFEDGQVAAG